MQISHPWECPRSGWMGPWSNLVQWKMSLLKAGGWTKWSLRSLSTQAIPQCSPEIKAGRLDPKANSFTSLRSTNKNVNNPWGCKMREKSAPSSQHSIMTGTELNVIAEIGSVTVFPLLIAKWFCNIWNGSIVIIWVLGRIELKKPVVSQKSFDFKFILITLNINERLDQKLQDQQLAAAKIKSSN